jgi:hypothetical protein
MTKLSQQVLERGMAAATFHGYGTFLPEPPEFNFTRKNWKSIKALLASVDLDTYDGYSPIRSFAPKSRLNVRRVSLLHPCHSPKLRPTSFSAVTHCYGDDFGKGQAVAVRSSGLIARSQLRSIVT